MKFAAELALATRAAREAAAMLSSTFARDAGVRTAEGKDIKTRADSEAENLILKALAVSGLPVIAEESAAGASQRDDLHWLVDPLDGTMNFSRGFPMHAVSIALWEGSAPRLGVIVDIPRGRAYRGVVGEGAWCDGDSISVSAIEERSQAVLATGFPTARDYGNESLTPFIQRVQAFKKIRMIGSAALSLAMVAEGTFEAYFEEGVMLWDVAAGLALVAAAGGTISSQSTARHLSVVAVATNGHITVPQ